MTWVDGEAAMWMCVAVKFEKPEMPSKIYNVKPQIFLLFFISLGETKGNRLKDNYK